MGADVSTLTREELEQTAKWFDCVQSETLTQLTLADALCELVDQAGQDALTLDDVTVDCYVPHEWHEKRRQWWANHIVDHVLDSIDNDDELACMDGHEITAEVRATLLAASRVFVDVVAEHVKPGMAKSIGSFTVPIEEAIEIVRGVDAALVALATGESE